MSDEAGASALIANGNNLEDAGRFEEALQNYASAVELAPNLPKAHLNLGNLLLRKGNEVGAMQAYRRALEIDPEYAAAHFNSGNVLFQLRRFDEAITAYQRAIAYKSDFVDAFVALGNAQFEIGDAAAAAASYRRAISFDANYAQVHYNLGNALQRLKDPKAVQAYRAALRLNPSFGAALAHAYTLDGQQANWSHRVQDERALTGLIHAGVGDIPPLVTLIMESPGESLGELQKRAARQFAEHHCGHLLAASKANRIEAPAQPGRLHVGYISADFRQHAVMHLLEGVLTGHDRSQVAVTCYSTGKSWDATTQRIRSGCETFRDLRTLSDAEAASVIQNDKIQILVDLQGYTTDSRVEIVARRPAPIIVNWIGYPATVGDPRLADYIIADRIVAPKANEGLFSETLALMPNSYIPTDNRWQLGDPPARSSERLPDEAIVLCSFNQIVKLNPSTFDVWCRILRAVPESVLWLLHESDLAVENLRDHATRRGIAAGRLIFAARMAPPQHFDRLQLADLALDTFPYVSHTTASDALWAGVPVITKAGEAFASRVAASLLAAIGLPELIVASDEQYENLTVEIASNREELDRLKKKLKTMRSTMPAFDTDGFARDLERLFQEMWADYKQGRRETIVLAERTPRKSDVASEFYGMQGKPADSR